MVTARVRTTCPSRSQPEKVNTADEQAYKINEYTSIYLFEYVTWTYPDLIRINCIPWNMLCSKSKSALNSVFRKVTNRYTIIASFITFGIQRR